MSVNCILCRKKTASLFQSDPFLRCSHCELVFKNGTVHLPPQEEEHRYRQHDNRIDNPGYVEFLTPALNEIQKRLPLGANGVDYGCGPNPVLRTLLKNAGYPTVAYDFFFFKDGLKDLSRIDFATCTEAAEHFFNPCQEFKTLFSLLDTKGVLVLMTEFYMEGVILKDWYYTRDPTHVCFYSKHTLEWIAETYSRTVEILGRRLAVFY